MSGAPETPANHPFLKIAVIVMSVLIVLGLGVVLTTIAVRVAGGGAGAGWGERRLDLPRGARVLGVSGAGERLILRLEMPGGAERLLIVDLKTGQRLGSLDLVTER